MRCALAGVRVSGRVRNASRFETGSLAVGPPNVEGKSAPVARGVGGGPVAPPRGRFCAIGEKGAQPGGVEFLKAALFLRIDWGGQRPGEGAVARDRLGRDLAPPRMARPSSPGRVGRDAGHRRSPEASADSPSSRLNAFGGKGGRV